MAPVLLAVDDNADNLFVLEQLLAEYFPECQMVRASCGADALDLVPTRSFDAALIDQQMPGMDGIELCRRLKTDPATSHIPVVLITAHAARAEIRAAALDAGADDFITKPIDNLELVAKVKVMMRIRHAEDDLRALNTTLERLVMERTRALGESERRYRRIVENVADYVYQARVTDGRAVSMDHGWACVAVTGYTAAEFHQDPGLWSRLVPADDWSGVSDRIAAAVSEGEGTSVEHRLVRKDGAVRWVRHTVVPGVDGEGRTTSYDGVIADITDRKLAEEALRTSEARYRTLFDSVADAVSVHDLDGRFLQANREAVERLGFTGDELRQRGLADITATDCADSLRAHVDELHREGHAVFEAIHVRADGTPLPVEVRSRLIMYQGRAAILCTSRDIGERLRAAADRERLEMQLRQAQKMEAIGTLAGGIAHDFNNILTAVLGYVDLALDGDPAAGPPTVELEGIRAGAQRAAGLVRQILAFARPGDAERRPVDMAALLTEALQLLRPSIPTTIAIETDVAPGPHWVMADPNQLHQVVVNLCTNAYQSMRARGGRLRAGLGQVDLGLNGLVANARSGRYVHLSLVDTGHGMDEQTKARIFEPFFTTRGVGEGTGLGLAVTHGIVTTSGGYITVQSEIGRGSRFDVYLPLAGTPPVVAEASVRHPERGDGHVLIVDDEEPLALMAGRTLENLGYRVSVETSSARAIEMVRRAPRHFDVVVTDQTMPWMTGAQLVEALLRIRPDLPIVITTGYSEVLTKEAALALGAREFLMKPFTAYTLAAAVARALAGTASAARGQ